MKKCAFCYQEEKNALLIECPGCKSYYLCHTCRLRDIEMKGHRTRYSPSISSECQRFLSNRRTGNLVPKEVPSLSISVKEQIFGEGAERIVRKVRFLDQFGGYVGPAMVAKESRFVETHGNSYEEQMDYHREFMRTQSIASDFAKKFNEALLQVQSHFGQEFQGTLNKLPRIQFIEPLIVKLNEGDVEKNILVEQLLEGDYKKFNNNLGFVEDDFKQLVERMSNLGLGGNFNRPGNDGLGAIEEGSEEESDEENEEIFDTKQAAPYSGSYRDLQDAYFPQAFSHFTYEKSKRQLMVVDLQGVFTVKGNGSKIYELTDPVIHKRRTNKNKQMKKWSFGRTDRGERGMKAFFETHRCTDACKFLGLSEVRPEHV